MGDTFKLVTKSSLNNRFMLEFISTSKLNVQFNNDSIYTSMIALQISSPIEKPYTPFSLTLDESGHLFVKYYVKLIDNGSMSKSWELLQKDDVVQIRFIELIMNSGLSTQGKVGIITGGTGITTCWQWINRLKKERQSIQVIAAYSTLADVALSPNLLLTKESTSTQITKLMKDRIHLFPTVSTLTDEERLTWTGGRGIISKDMLNIMLPSPNELETRIVLCGPPAMLQYFCGRKAMNAYMQRDYKSQKIDTHNIHLDKCSILGQLGYRDDQIILL